MHKTEAGGKYNVDVPDLLLCNSNPFSSFRENSLLLDEYLMKIKRLTQCDGCEANETVHQMRSVLQTKESYFMYLGENIKSMVLSASL